MAQAFAMKRVTEAVWPEILALFGLAGLHLLARTADGWMAWNRPFRRASDWTHVGVLGVAGYCLGTNRAPDVLKAVIYGDSMLLATAAGDWAYEKTVGPSIARVKAQKLAGRGISEPASVKGAVIEAERILQQARAQAAQMLAAAKGGGNPGRQLAVTQKYSNEEILA